MFKSSLTRLTGKPVKAPFVELAEASSIVGTSESMIMNSSGFSFIFFVQTVLLGLALAAAAAIWLSVQAA